MAADAPEECDPFFELDFNSNSFSTFLDVPDYLNWVFLESDYLGLMRFHKRVLQHLQSGE